MVLRLQNEDTMVKIGVTLIEYYGMKHRVTYMLIGGHLKAQVPQRSIPLILLEIVLKG